MDINVKITLEETPALINCFSTFVDCLQKLVTPVISTSPITLDIKAEEPVEATPQNKTATPVAEAPTQAAVPTAPTHKYTLEEIQSACGPLMDAGKLDELAALLQKFGVASLPEISEDQYGAIAVELRALGARI